MGVNGRLCMKPPCSKAVRQGDPREQGCVWKIWRSVWSSMTASLLFYTPPFPFPILTAEFKIGCTTFPQCSRTFTILSRPLLSGIFYSYTDGYLPNEEKDTSTWFKSYWGLFFKTRNTRELSAQRIITCLNYPYHCQKNHKQPWHPLCATVFKWKGQPNLA